MSRPKNRSNDLVGKQIDGFEVRAQIAARDTSVLYLVHDTTEDHPLFLEIMTDTVKQEPLLAKRFRRRMETVARLPHPNIGQINDVGVTSTDQPYAAGEYFESVTLAEMLANLANTEKSLSTK